MAARLGDVEVDRDHQVELAECAAQVPARSGTDSTGLPEETNRARIWPRPGSRDLLGHDRGRERPQNLREVADPRAERVVAVGAEAVQQILELNRPGAEDRPARRVEVAGDDVEGVEQERDEGAATSETRPGPAVDRGAARRRQRRGRAGEPRRRGPRCVTRSSRAYDRRRDDAARRPRAPARAGRGRPRAPRRR